MAASAIAIAVAAAAVIVFCSTTKADVSSLDAARRNLPPTVTWALSGAVLVIALTIATVLAVKRIVAHQRNRTVTIAILVVAALVFVGFGRGRPVAFGRVYDVLGGTTEPFVALAARWMGSFGLGASVLIAAAFVHLALCARVDSPEAQRRRLAAAQELLFASAIGLAAGAIATFARLLLQVDPGLEETERKAALAVVQATTIGYGGFFTLLLLGTYVPTSFFMARSTESLAAKANVADDRTERSKWLAQNGLQDKTLTRVLKMLAAFLPLLTSALSGPIASVLQKLVA